MGAAPPDAKYGVFRFLEPDLSVPAEERAIFAGPASKVAKEETIELHDFRTATDVAKGARGLDVQAFTYLNHTSSLTGDEILEETNAEDIYAPEVIDFILGVTGGSRAVVHNIAFRRKLATKQVDLYHVNRAGGEWDDAIKRQPCNRISIQGRDDDRNEPARHAHCDMTLESLSDTIRLCRRDISEAAKPSIDAEDMRKTGAQVRVPRYAAYSVWRPLKTVKRDPIAVLDYRSIDKEELVETDFRVPSELTKDNEYVVRAWLHLPPRNPKALKWYWMSEQGIDEVLIIKFSDSASAEDASIAAGCIHCSPILAGTEDEEPRCSVECRVYVFWD